MGLFDDFNGRLLGGQQEVNLSAAEKEKKDLEMVKKNGFALRCVKKQTPDICMAAVQKNPGAIKFIRDPKMRKQVEEFLKQGQVSTMSLF